jgi:hypothetical protein
MDEDIGRGRTRHADASQHRACFQRAKPGSPPRSAGRTLHGERNPLCDPETATTGRKAISEAIDSLRRMLPPGFVFTSVGHAAGHNSAGRLFWRAGPPDGLAAITGLDVAHIEGGRIKLLYVFVDPIAR